MTKEQKIDRFHEIVNSMANLYAKKNENYGDSFGQLYKDLGPISGLVPLHNKLDRLTNLIKGGRNDFESIEDIIENRELLEENEICTDWKVQRERRKQKPCYV